MAEFDIFKDFAYGDLNPILPKGGKVYRDDETSGIEAMKIVAAESYENETILGTGPYKAICLRKENAEYGGTNNAVGVNKISWLDRVFTSLNSSPPAKFVEIKASIPELHGAMLPAPKDFNDHAAINRFPTFIARHAGMNDPDPGDVVWVDFGNRITLQDPQYLGRLHSVPGAGPNDSAGGAFPCDRGLNKNAPAGDAVKTSREPLAKIGPTMAPSYQPINIETERGKVPRGKGVIIDGLGKLSLSKYPVETAKKAGLSWVSIYCYKIKKNGAQKIRDWASLKTFIDEYHKNGIKCYIYGWATIGAGKGYNEAKFKSKNSNQEPEELFIKNMINTAIHTGAMGIEIKAEEDCYAIGTSKEVNGKFMYSAEVITRNENFARRMKEQCKVYRLPFGYTSTTPTKLSAKIGHYFASWAKYSDYAIPQVYSMSGFHSADHWKKGYNGYENAGFKNIIPGLGAMDVKKPNTQQEQAKAPDRMRWEAHQCYNQNLKWSDAIIWSSWTHLDKRERWSVVQEMGIEVPQLSTNEETVEVISSGVSTGQTTSSPVSSIGPSMSQTPATETKEKSAEVIKEKKPLTWKVITSKIKTLAELSKNRNFDNEPITRTDLFAFTKEPGPEIDRLLNLMGATATSSPDPLDIQKLESLKSEAKNNILEITKPGSEESKIKLLETEIVGIKKQIKMIDAQGITNNQKASLKHNMTVKENQIKTLMAQQKKPSQKGAAPSINCRTTTNRAKDQGPPGEKIPLSLFVGSKYPGAITDDLAVELPGQGRRTMGVNQILIHDSGNHTVKGTCRILARKNLSVHFTIDLNGKVRQHVPLDRRAFHAGKITPAEQNNRSIGIEMITRYIPDRAKYSRHGQPVIVNPIFTRGWALSSDGKKVLGPTQHSGKNGHGRVRVPSQKACEAAWQLCKWLPTQISTLKIAFPGSTSKGFLWTGGNSNHPEKRFDDGITSHGRSATNRSDGLFTEHYCFCRSLGKSSSTAFKMTIAAATWTKPERPKRNKAYTNYHKGSSYLTAYIQAFMNPDRKPFKD
jgi:hypothetical protein